MNQTKKATGADAQSLNTDQLRAIVEYAKAYGRCWRSELRSAWSEGTYGEKDSSGYLQQIRNEHGPRWLIKFSLVKAQAALAEVDFVAA